MRNDNDVGNELKAVAHDVMQMGARCVQAGRAWLTERRNEMTDRNDEYRSDTQPRGNPRRQTEQASYGRQQGDRQQGGYQHGSPQSRSQQGGYQQGGYQQNQQGGYQQNQTWQQGGNQPRGQQQGQEYASRDYGRAQAYGQEGLEREYGQSFERGYGETLYGETTRGENQYGRDRNQGFQESHQGGRERYQGGAREYGDYTGRQTGEGYGRSSSYGNPDAERYGGGAASAAGASFVSPADTQLSHAGMGQRSYRGIGPKNYTRSDERVNEDLCERLTTDSDIDASEIEVKVADGTATLEGTVPQRWMKHRAEDVADSCSGVRNVENRIRVQSAASYSGPSMQRDETGGSDTLAGQAQGSTKTAH